MTQTPIVRPAVPEDSDRIAEILRSSFPGELLPYTILSGAGLSRYLRDTIQAQARNGSSLYVVAVQEERVIVGCAEVRRAPDRLFLNHIYVVPPAQGKGMGRRLLREGIDRSRDRGQSCLELDVFAQNHVAQRWYRSLGLTPVLEQVWVEAALPDGALGQEQWWMVSHLPQADLIQTAYGFSQFTLYTSSRAYEVGRLGASYFRCAAPDILDDPAALSALHRLDAYRKLLCVGPVHSGAGPSGPGRTLLARSRRLRGDVDRALTRLQYRVSHGKD